MHLFYLYKNHRELKNLYQLIKGQFEMYGDAVRPTKATGTRWIDHKIHAMERIVRKDYIANIYNKQSLIQKNQKTELRYKESSTS